MWQSAWSLGESISYKEHWQDTGSVFVETLTNPSHHVQRKRIWNLNLKKKEEDLFQIQSMDEASKTKSFLFSCLRWNEQRATSASFSVPWPLFIATVLTACVLLLPVMAWIINVPHRPWHLNTWSVFKRSPVFRCPLWRFKRHGLTGGYTTVGGLWDLKASSHFLVLCLVLTGQPVIS